MLKKKLTMGLIAVCLLGGTSVALRQEEDEVPLSLLATRMAEPAAETIQNDYQKAVSYILDEKYTEAMELLEDSQYQDSAALYEYCTVVNDTEIVKIEDCRKALESCSNIENAAVAAQYDTVMNRLETTEELQKLIDQINVEEIVTLDNSEELHKLYTAVADTDPRYARMLSTKKLDTAMSVLANLEEGNEIGVLITEIAALPEVTLESEESIGTLMSQYNSLSADQKKEVVNYKDLKNADQKLQTLKKEKKEAEDKAAKEAAELAAKEAAEKAAAEQAAREAEEKAAAEALAAQQAAEAEAARTRAAQEAVEAYNNTTVYISNSGHKYHEAGCYHLKSSHPISRGEAIAQGYTPCAHCNPG